jgi:hypothetical protein
MWARVMPGGVRRLVERLRLWPSAATAVLAGTRACLKTFRILTERYRSRRNRFSLRFNSVAGAHNFGLGLGWSLLQEV